MKKLLFSTLMAIGLFSSSLTAAPYNMEISIMGTDGNELLSKVAGSDVNKITFNDRQVGIFYQDNLSATPDWCRDMSDVRSINFNFLNTGLTGVADARASFRLVGATLYFDSTDSCPLEIFSVNGMKVSTSEISSRGISVDYLQPGVYIARAGGKTFKFNR